MSSTIQFAAQISGLSPKFLTFDQDGKIWSTTAQIFEAYSTANRANYEISMTELGTASKHYTGVFDSNIPSGNYSVEIRDQAGEASSVIAVNPELDWSGTAFNFLSTSVIVDALWDEQRSLHSIGGSFGEGVDVAPDGLDNIATADPAGPASNFTERMNLIYARQFHKHTLDATTFSTFDASGASVITVQTVSNDGTTETIDTAAGP